MSDCPFCGTKEGRMCLLLTQEGNCSHHHEKLLTAHTPPFDSVETPKNPLEVQSGGNHYKSMPIQPIEYSMANGLDMCQANVVKYVTRFREKNGVEDLNKARHCIDLLEHFEYGEGNPQKN